LSARRRALRLAILGCVAALGATIPAQAKAQPSFGYNDGWFLEPDTIIQAVAGGADTIRVSFSWAQVERDRGTLLWGGYDEMYQRILAAGARPLIVVIGAPWWAAAGKRCGPNALTKVPKASQMDRWGRFVGRVARRYPEARAIEVWNEQNFTKFWPGKLNPRKYGRVLRAAGRGARKSNPNVPVISGGLLPSLNSDRKQMAFPKFLKRSLRVAGRRNYDGAGIHPFPFFADDYLGKVRTVVRKTRRITRRAGGRKKTIWVTEVGVSTAPPDNYSLRGQARALGAIYDALARMPDVPAIIIHRFMDDPRGGTRDAGWGVISSDGSLKPAFCALARRRGLPC
jgi:hypothetical protein